MDSQNGNDGSKSLTKESKRGLAVQFLGTLAATAALGKLDALDLTTLPGWMMGAAVFGVTTLTGLLTAYVTKNRG